MAKPNKKRLDLDLSKINFLKKLLHINKIEDIDKAILIKLKELFKDNLTDVRQKSKCIFKIWDVVICTFLACLAENTTWDDIHDFVEEHYKWIRSFLKMTGGIPSSYTYERVLSLLDHKELEDVLTKFVIELSFKPRSRYDLINIDGRVDCGSSRKKTDFHDAIKPLNSLNAYSTKYGFCLASEMIDEKTNEIPTIPIILDRLNIDGVTITWDALNTQVANIKKVREKNGNYVVPIKGNQPNFYHDLELYFNDRKLEEITAGNTKSAYLKEIEKSHSSFITYEYFQINDTDWYFDKDNWIDLTTIGLVKKTTVKNDEITVEKRYYISNLNIDIKLFSHAIRNHWGVENKLHWHLDFTFKEDDNTTSNKNALMNLQIINKTCLALLNRVKPFYKNISLRRIRNKLNRNFEDNFIEFLCYLILS